MFKIEDEVHAERYGGRFPTLEAALVELQLLALIPWGQEPNVAPCKGGEGCQRLWEIIEYDDSTEPWKVLQRGPMLRVSAQGIEWPPLHEDTERGPAA